MDLEDIKLAADIIFDICKKHPKICPHLKIKPVSSKVNADGKLENRYICELCSTEIVEAY